MMPEQEPFQPAQAILSAQAIRALRAIILTSICGIIFLSGWSLALRYGLFGNGNETLGGVVDEALSILGNIASASVGGLVGWLTRDIVVRGRQVEQGVLEEDTTSKPPITYQFDESTKGNSSETPSTYRSSEDDDEQT